ncbi:squalene--hopene cyclase [bacterium]|nr:squalene--hopene cyclase [bacterium]
MLTRRELLLQTLAALPVCAVSGGREAALVAAPDNDWEVTPSSELALRRGVEWLARNQGPQGNWESNDLGLVGLGVLAFLANGHLPGRGRFGAVVERALDYVLRNAQASGLLNIADPQRDMYNHGLATFVLGQAHGMTDDRRISRVLEQSLKLIANTQARDGGWDYRARRQSYGHDLSLVVMQAKALRSAVDSGLEVRSDVIQLAIQSVRQKYRAANGARNLDDPRIQEGPGQFTYDGHNGTTAMAAAGVVCLQEFGQYDDWRIPKNMDVIAQAVKELKPSRAGDGRVAFDAYTLYYVGQALYQVGGQWWKECYPLLRDNLVTSQIRKPSDVSEDGAWRDPRYVTGGRPSLLFGTSVACFLLAIPNRYLPILQEGKIESVRKQF